MYLKEGGGDEILKFLIKYDISTGIFVWKHKFT